MSFTVANVRDDAKASFGLTTSDTGYDSLLLAAFNREVAPDLRGVMLLADEHYFDEIALVNLVDGTSLYAPTKVIRKLWAVHALDDASSQLYKPLRYSPEDRQLGIQVDTGTSANVWGYYMEGGQIRLRDIPRTSITNGLRFDYTPAFAALAANDTVFSSTNPLAEDFAPAFISGLCLKLARTRKDKDMITVYWAEYNRLRRELQINVESRVEADLALDSGDPTGL